MKRGHTNQNDSCHTPKFPGHPSIPQSLNVVILRFQKNTRHEPQNRHSFSEPCRALQSNAQVRYTLNPSRQFGYEVAWLVAGSDWEPRQR